MYQDSKGTCIAVLLLIKPFFLVTVLSRSIAVAVVVLLKLPNIKRKVKKSEALEPRLAHSCRSLSRFL